MSGTDVNKKQLKQGESGIIESIKWDIPIFGVDTIKVTSVFPHHLEEYFKLYKQITVTFEGTNLQKENAVNVKIYRVYDEYTFDVNTDIFREKPSGASPFPPPIEFDKDSKYYFTFTE